MTPFKTCRLVLVLFYALLFPGLALYDESPSTTFLSQVAAEPTSEAIIDPQNLWLAMKSFDNLVPITPEDYGRELIKHYTLAVQEHDLKDLMDFKKNQQHLAHPGTIESGVFNKGMLLPFVLENPDTAADYILQNTELLQRYQQLCTYNEYASLSVLNYLGGELGTNVMYAQRPFLISVALQASKGEIRQALQLLNRDMDFWRFSAIHSHSLIARLAANRGISQIMGLSVSLSNHFPLTSAEQHLVSNILRPFSPQELKSYSSITGESRAGLIYFADLIPDHKKIDRILYKRQAVANLVAENNVNQNQLASLSMAEFTKQVPSFYPLKQRRLGFSFLYNPLGELLIQQPRMKVVCLAPTIERSFALEGQRRIALLEIMAHKEGINAQKMPQFLKQQAETANLGNPFYATPMDWNSEKQKITFKLPTEMLPEGTELFN